MILTVVPAATLLPAMGLTMLTVGCVPMGVITLMGTTGLVGNKTPLLSVATAVRL